jgi:Mrp family chromosome partitioning ATPase
MAVTVDPRVQADLQEAIREIHIMAGLGEPRQDGMPQRSLSIGVTSPNYSDGKTTIAMALASGLAHDLGKDVALADLDFHTHSVGREYGLEGSDGMAEVLSGERALKTVTHRHREATISVVTAGNVPLDAARMANSDRLISLIESLKAKNAYVVFDLPAALHSMNTPILAQRCDGVIVVVRDGATRRQELDRVLHLLRDAKILGVVVNRQRTSVPRFIHRALGLSG